MSPKKSEFHLELGNFYSRTGLKAKAIIAYQKALQLDPDSEKIQKALRKITE